MDEITPDIKNKISTYQNKIEEEFKSVFGITSTINILNSKTLKQYPGKSVRVKDLRKVPIII